MAVWKPLSLASALYAPPSALATMPAPVIGKLEELPFNLLSWENFERLLLRMMRDIEGLRDAQMYGDRGQKQLGLDVVALAPDGAGVALQSKKYQRFTAGPLKAAVKKFQTTKRPFEVHRLILGVACVVKSTGAIDELTEQRKALHPIVLELWDAQELSALLRNRPEIVIEYFGMPTAEAFCLPFKIDVALVPSADAAAVREAIARTPEVSTGAQQLFDKAAVATDPEEALSLIGEGQTLLRDAGFRPHAALHEKERMRLLARVGRADEAARQILDDFWVALDQGLSATAQLTRSRLDELLQHSPENVLVTQYVKVIEAATSIYFDPLGLVPDVDSLRQGDLADQVRLFLLAGETARASDNTDWLSQAALAFAEFSRLKPIDDLRRTRLRILIAESTTHWSELLTDARKLKLGYGLSGLVIARHARSLALNQKFEEADLAWDEASGLASLAGHWDEASTWIFSRRAFRSRWNPFTSDELLPLQTAIREMGSSTPLMPSSDDAYEVALSALSDQKLRTAAISAQRALRDAVTKSDWVGEERARRVLASILIESDEPEPAAHHLARAGAVKAIETLGNSLSLEFIDIIDDLDATNYWTVGAAYRLIATQADLVPNSLVDSIVERIIAELVAADTGGRPDLRSFTTSRYNNALKALGGIADRIDVASSEAALSHFENQPTVIENHYRYHDDAEALTVAKIALSQPSLTARAMAHLVPLLGRAQGARSSTAREAIDKYFSLAQVALTELADDGNHWARETLAFNDTTAVNPAVATEALARLATPLTHVMGVYSVGTKAIGDSLLIGHLPAKSVNAAVSELLVRADDPHINSSDRGEYLIAAANLSDRIDQGRRGEYFENAMRIATSPTPSDHDILNEQFTHKLGGVRMNGFSNGCRGEALFLAATLAGNESQRSDVRRAVYSLLGEKEDYWPTRALQRLGDTLKDDLAFLASQGWAIRSFAATLWVDHGEPVHLGERLARDPDVRVRRALAHALAQYPAKAHERGVRDQLAEDPAYSVRTSLMAPSTLS